MYYDELDVTVACLTMSGLVVIMLFILFPAEPKPFGEQLQITEYVTAYKHGNSFEIK